MTDFQVARAWEAVDKVSFFFLTEEEAPPGL
jgi:hypothetical protein